MGSQRLEAWERFADLKMEETTWQGEWVACRAESSPWVTTSKEQGTSVLQLQGAELDQQE